MRILASRRFPLFASSLMTALMLASTLSATSAHAAARANEFKLANGMQVVVIEDKRAPVVTHMVWYRVGAADEPRGESGIAHFLEHLMFKSTEKIAIGEFSKIVAKLGGQDNAFTSQDTTAYFQRVAKDRLAKVMSMEADRMVNLRLTDNEVLTERNVILEERRSRVDNNPSAILSEQMDATLYYSHPYAIPVIGWEHEIARLDREDALNFYKHYYAPNNAILVVSGDVGVDEVRKLAEETYGKVPSNPSVGANRLRPVEPPQLAARELVLKDPRAGKASFHRYYLAPSYVKAQKGEAEALDVLVRILANGSTSRLYKSLVVDKKIASSAGGWYHGDGLDSGKVALYAIAADGSDLNQIEADIDRVISDVAENGVAEDEMRRAKMGLTADYIYESDNQSNMARRYGWGLVVGQSIEDIEEWPAAIERVTAEDVKNAAKKTLDIRQSVSGRLLPEADNDAGTSNKRASTTASPRG